MATGKRTHELNASSGPKKSGSSIEGSSRKNAITAGIAVVLFAAAGFAIWNNFRERDPVVNAGDPVSAEQQQKLEQEKTTYQGKPIPVELQGTQPVGKRWIPPPEGSK